MLKTAKNYDGDDDMVMCDEYGGWIK